MQRVMIISRTWMWVCLKIALIICLKMNDVTKARETALVGTVYCDTCFRQDFMKSIHFISGALVAVECGGEEIQASGGRPRFRREVKTDVEGVFKVKLPFSPTKHINEIKGCSIKFVSSSEPDCALAVTASSSSIRLKVKTPENHVFSAGSFAFQPLEHPKLCHLNARDQNSNDEISASTPLPSPVVVVDGLLAPPSRPSPTTILIPHVIDGKQTEIKLHDLDDESDFGFPNLPNQFLPPSLIPFFQNQPPPDSMFTPDFQPPPNSVFSSDFQPPPNSVFSSDFQPPPNSVFTLDFQPPLDSNFNPEPIQPPPSEFNPIPLQTPPPSDFNPIPLPPPPLPEIYPGPLPLPPPSDFDQIPLQTPPPDFDSIPLQPPPPSENNPMPLQPPSPSEFNPIPLQPPPDSTLDPLQTPPDSTFDPLQASPPSLIPQLFTPPPPPSPIPSLDSPPVEQPPDAIQATPPPQIMPPPPTLMPPFPPFPFQPGQGFPGTPPPTKKTLSP